MTSSSEAIRSLTSKAGHTPDRHEFLSQFPDVAAQLDKHIEGIELLHALTPQSQADGRVQESVHESAFAPQMMLRDFRIVRQIGRGGMGVVYKAEQLSLQRTVAIKVLPFAALLDERHLKRFKNEARAAASLDHAHIVPVYFVGQERGIHYYAMRLVDGQSLAELIDDLQESEEANGDHGAGAAKTTSFSETFGVQRLHRSEYFKTIATLGVQAAEALEHAHEIGILHRDIKPSNLLVDATGHLHVTDFGLAQFDHGDTLTRTGGVVGTAAYMSPEQAAASRSIDGRSDVYSLGATLYELLVLRRAQPEAPSQYRDVVPLRIDPRTPQDLDTIISKAVSIDRRDRYATAQELADDLRSFVVGGVVRARKLSRRCRAARWAARHRRVLVPLSMVAALVLVVLFFGMAWYSNRVAEHAVELKAALKSREQAVQRAERLLSRAKYSELTARRLSYRTDLEQAFQLWNTHYEYAVSERLDRQIPNDDQVDLRGIEWRLLNAELRSRYFVLGRHRGMATECVLFPDQETAASVGEDGFVHIWNLPTRSRSKSFNPECGPLHALAISPDGKTLAVGGSPSLARFDLGLVYLLDAASGTRRGKPLQRHPTTVESVAFSPDGRFIAAASRYSEVKLSSVDGHLLHTFHAPRRNRSLAFSPSGDVLAILHDSHSIRILDCKTGSLLREIPYHHEIGHFRWSPMEPLIAVCSHRKPWADLLESNPRVSPLPGALSNNHLAALLPTGPFPHSLSAMAHKQDGKQLVAGDVDGKIRQWRTPNVEFLHLRASSGMGYRELHPTRTVHAGIVNDIAVTDHGDILSTSDSGTVVMSTTGSALESLHLADYTALAVNVQGTRYYSGDGTGAVRTSDLSGRPAEVVYRVARSIDGLVVTADNSRVGIVDSTGEVTVFDARSNETIWSTPNPSAVESSDGHRYQVTLSSDGERLAVTGPDDLVSVWDVGRRQRLWSNRQVKVRTMAFDEGGHKLAYGGYFETLEIVDADSGTALHSVRGGVSTGCIDFSPDSRLVVAGNNDGGVRILDVTTGEVRTMRGHSGAVMSVVFSAEGRSIMSFGGNSTDKAIRLWDTASAGQFGAFTTIETLGRNFGFRATPSSLILFDRLGDDSEVRRWEF